jgi:HNH endonuclease
VPTSVLRAADALCQALADFDARLLSGTDAARVAEGLAVAEKRCAAARLLAAARAIDAGAHKELGAKDGASWLARQSGATGSQARQALETVRSVEDCPDTKAAFVAGELSLSQAAEITQAEAETPGAEQALLSVARRSDLSQLRDEARQHRQAPTDVDDLHRQQRAARSFRHWRDRMGMVCFAGSLPPDTGLPLVRRVEIGACRARRVARQLGQPDEPFQAHAADVFAGLLAPSGDTAAGDASTGGRRGNSRPAELVIVCDLYAWRRGYAVPGEACHIIGGGPIPVDLAHELSGDAFLKAVLHDGVAIHTVSHFGRSYPAHLRTALDLGPVPGFTGRQCADCGTRWGLQYDHVNPVANRGPTRYSNLEPRCWTCHHAKTERDRQAGLLGPKARARARSPNAS